MVLFSCIGFAWEPEWTTMLFFSSQRVVAYSLPQPTSWVWICPYLICIRLLVHWSHSHVYPLYIHWKIKLQKFFYVAIYVQTIVFLYSGKYHSLQDLMNLWALIPRGNGMHTLLENREAQPNVKMFSFLPPKPPIHLGNPADGQTADVCRQLSILPTEVGCVRGAHRKLCLSVSRVIDATGSGYFYAICYSKASHCSLSVLTPSHSPVPESQSSCFYQ